ncbi:TOPRIM domain-containing protein [Caballeronia cordobensis]|uniref:TOPRIM domain-containing protein n=1 Tax=Caballeronia cordobensis TaxID=1353886 RepID=A0A158JCX9_CABCO|nr:AAA family ATPase [Caballeronia cordobensis]SAL66180.1 TOPRIM domain-containing protein [Caballeronia cordobensis]
MRNADDLTRCAALIEFNDMRRQHIDAATLRAAKPDAAKANSESKRAHTTNAARVILQRAADVQPQPIRWLWPDWLPAGKLTILAGAAGRGKTTLALAFAAVVSRGGRWPDGSACADGGNVLVWSSEDDVSDTLVPRLILAGADLNRVHFVCNVKSADGELMPFDPARDMPLLSEQIAEIGGARLLLVDPVLSAVSGDAHRANDVRRNLQPLVDLAAAHGCAVIGISHFSKGTQGRTPVERVLGSQAFGALARMVLVTAKDEGAERRILARAKSNVAPDDGGFAYRLERREALPGIVSNCVEWGERIEGSAREILNEVERDPDMGGEFTERDEAAAFLRSLLSDGPLAAKQIESDARGAGHAWRTIERAKRDMDIEARKIGQKWVWALPSEDRQPDAEDRQAD